MTCLGYLRVQTAEEEAFFLSPRWQTLCHHTSAGTNWGR